MRGTTRSRTIPFIIISVAFLIKGVVFQYFVAGQSDDPAVSSASQLTSAATASSGGSMVFHEKPQPVPEISFIDGDERALSLADFGGRTVLLNIWATWCIPCREEMPSLDRLQAKLGDSSFEVVPVSIDRGGLEVVRVFYGELGLSELDIYVDATGKAAFQLNTVGIPTTLLINPEGLETGRLVGAAEWDSSEMIDLIQKQLGKTPGEANLALITEH